jgi:hypothetical protein
MELYLYSPICLHGVDREKFIFIFRFILQMAHKAVTCVISRKILFPWERCQKDQNSTNRPQLYTRTHANTQALWVQKGDYLALFSQLMNRFSQNVSKDLPQLAVTAQDSAVFMKDLSEEL